MSNSIVSVIPARGGSKGIPRKNLRTLNGKRLIGHPIRKSQSVDLIDAVVVTTEDRKIEKVARSYQIDNVVRRPDRLAEDDVPLAPVIEHAMVSLEAEYDYVLCFQPTVPLIKQTSLEEGMYEGINDTYDSVVFVRDSTHHFWQQGSGGPIPFSEERQNRQEMSTIYEEIGIFLTSTSVVRDGRRIGDSPTLHEVDIAEGNDIDTFPDWVLAKNWLNRQSILYRVTGDETTGMGHIYRGVTLAMNATEHDFTFAVSSDDALATDVLEQNNFGFEVFDSDKECLRYVRQNNPDIVVNDILTTSEGYVTALRDLGARVVNIEDLSDGSRHADAVVNSLYEFSDPPDDHYYGYQYFCLRNEFQHSTPLHSVSDVERIMVSFGGVDPSDVTSKTVRAIDRLDAPVTLDVVLGPGYESKAELEGVLAELSSDIQVDVNQDVPFMTDHMEQADLLITSNGRTVHEAAALNLPMISIAQNQREQQHQFAHVTRGIVNLGLADYVSEENISRAVSDYLNEPETRERMRAALAEFDIESGVDRVKQIIFDSGVSDAD